MRIVRADEVAELSADVPIEPGVLRPHWLEGPANGDRLDVGVITLSPGGVTPPHVPHLDDYPFSHLTITTGGYEM
jgi:hypothetical protein